MTAETTFAEKVLGLSSRVEDNLILYSDIWKRWDTEKSSLSSLVQVMNLDGERQILYYGRDKKLKTAKGIEHHFRPQIWRYI